MPKKRANGEGTISKRKDGSWMGRIDLGYINGKRHRKAVYGRTQAAVKEKLERVKRENALGTYVSASFTVAAHLDEYLDGKAPKKGVEGEYLPGRLKPTTYERKYKYCIEKHIKPRIGSKKLAKLTPYHVETMLADIAQNAGVPTANNCRRVLSTALKQAIRWGRLTVNPCAAVDALPETPREMTLWTPQQAARFLDTLRGHRLEAMFYLDMSTGMRRGELLGLRWEDVRGNVLHVEQTLNFIKGEFIFQTPKTRKGTRRVPLSPDTIDVLEAHRNRQLGEKDFMGEAWDETGLVFTTPAGSPIPPDSLHKVRKRLMKAANVPVIRLHDLRHLHASMAIKNGVDPKVLADRLGHSRASFTMDVYTHLFEEQRAQGAVSLLDFLPSKSGGEAN